MNPHFPILNISLESLDSDSIEEIHVGDAWDYPSDSNIFKKYYYQHHFVDQKGCVFVVTGKKKSNILEMLMYLKKERMIFEKTNKVLSFSDLQNLVINRYDTLESDFDKSILVGLAMQSKTISDLIG